MCSNPMDDMGNKLHTRDLHSSLLTFLRVLLLDQTKALNVRFGRALNA